MQRPNRNVEIFSLSSLDLFASAMGAFVIIAIVLLPYYMRTKQAQTSSANMDGQIVELEEQTKESQRIEQLALQAETMEVIKRKQRQAQVKLDEVTKKKQELQEKIKRSVQFVFLGMETDAESFVLVIDMSGSMTAYTDLVFASIDRILNALRPEQQLAVIGYRITGTNPEFFHWPDEHKLAAVTETNKQAASKFVRQLSRKFDGATPTYDALKTALKSPAEAIVLLTDGMPTHPVGLQPRQIISLISTSNGGNKEIHTVGLGEWNARPQFIEFLSNLAEANGGSFASIAR